MINRKYVKILACVLAASLAMSAASCSSNTSDGTGTSDQSVVAGGEFSSSNDSEHALEVSGTSKSYSGIKVTKSGDSDKGDEADFYGDNSAVFASDGAELTIENASIDTNGKHANAVFSYGSGTTVNISNSTISTSGDCSGGLMTTGDGTMNATNLTIHTTGNSSAAIRSDRGGGTVKVEEGTYTTDGKGSPVIYSTADITVSDASLESTSSEGVVVEGRNSVTLNDVTLIADNNTNNSNKSSVHKAVMIYQSMSGDAAKGTAAFTMSGGSLQNKNGDVFFVTNTTAKITLSSAMIVNGDENGVLLRAAAAGWGSEGSNGGKVDLYLNNQDAEGDIVVDKVSALNLYLGTESSYTGAVNAANEGEVYVAIESGSQWVLTGDSYVKSLSCEAGAVNLNGYKLYVNGTAYTEGSASTGSAVVFETSSSSHGGRPEGNPPDGKPGDKPDGSHEPPPGGRPEGTPPSKPDSI